MENFVLDLVAGCCTDFHYKNLYKFRLYILLKPALEFCKYGFCHTLQIFEIRSSRICNWDQFSCCLRQHLPCYGQRKRLIGIIYHDQS